MAHGQLAKELESRVHTLDVLHRLTEVVGRSDGLHETCSAAADAILTGTRARRASILLFDDAGVMRFVAWRNLSSRYRAAVDGHSPWSRDAADPEPILIRDVQTDPRVAAFRDVVLSEGIQALAFIPLVHQGTLLGKFMVYYDEAHDFAPSEVRLAQTIAHHAALAVVWAQAQEAAARVLRRERTAREEADAAKAELERTNVRKDEFLAMLAHELRNPLAVIVNSLDLLETSAAPPAARERMHGMIRRQSDHLVRLVDDLLDVARITTGRLELDREPVDLRGVVQHAAEGLRHALERRRQKLELSLPDSALTVLGDAVRLQQLFGNMLDNASKYSPHDGVIRARLAVDGDQAVVTIQDDGAGIPGDKLEAIFELFTRVDSSLGRPSGGLGIGLTLVKRIVELHGGTVVARSGGLGKGAEFEVRLPLLPPGRKRRVLVVEDQQDCRDMLVQVLQLHGFEVSSATTGAQALAASVSQCPEVVLVDLNLPDMNGRAVARELRRVHGAGLVLIAVSGYGQPSDRARSLEAGFDAHLVKPLEPSRLEEILANPRRAQLMRES